MIETGALVRRAVEDTNLKLKREGAVGPPSPSFRDRVLLTYEQV